MTAKLGTCFLYTWYSASRGDHFTTSDPAWVGQVGQIRNSGADYELMRIEGRVFSPDFPQPPGTVPLWNFWNPTAGDNFLTTQAHWVRSPQREGYTRFRLEGYLYTSAGEDRLPLNSFWNARTQDNLATTAIGDELYSFDGNWSQYRTEGYLLPEIQRVTPLYTWYGHNRGDHFTTTDPNWAGVVGDRRVSGVDYELMRVEGRVFSPDLPQPKGTRALWSFWNPAAGDNFLTTRSKWVRSRSREGYTRYRLEGFLYSTPGPGQSELVSYWNQTVQDHAATTAKPGDIRSLTPAWEKYRQEGFLFPEGQLVRPNDITEPLVPTAVLRGDREFDGNGPDITARLKLVVSPDGRHVIAKIYFLAFETKPDWSTTESTWEKIVYTAPAGRRILSLASPASSEVRFISPRAGFQILFPGEDLKDVTALIKAVSGSITSILQFVPMAGQVAKGVDASLSAFLEGLKVVGFSGNQVSTVVSTDGPVLFFAIVGDTGGDDISDDNNPKDDTRIVGIRMLDFEVVMA
ncbi:hypothetical protein C7293_04035 [filamentous cyanobacterium CCT1]|nr:hypothetical protein C7293_04035 [filamentous cyanobacterium CCT1]